VTAHERSTGWRIPKGEERVTRNSEGDERGCPDSLRRTSDAVWPSSETGVNAGIDVKSALPAIHCSECTRKKGPV